MASAVDDDLTSLEVVVKGLKVGCAHTLLPVAGHVTCIASPSLPQLDQIRFELITFAGLST